jgi:hypothetical protein
LNSNASDVTIRIAQLKKFRNDEDKGGGANKLFFGIHQLIRSDFFIGADGNGIQEESLKSIDRIAKRGILENF